MGTFSQKIRRIGLAAVAVTGAAIAVPAAPASAAESVHPQELRTLAPLASERLPAYKCPSARPYLKDWNFAPWGTSLLPGIEIQQQSTPWPIGVSITKGSARWSPERAQYVWTGMLDNPLASSATNWSLTPNSYRVVLHCTDNIWDAADAHPYGG